MIDLQRQMVAERIGQPVGFTVARDDRLFEITVTPAELAD